jgi:hypothetical protein
LVVGQGLVHFDALDEIVEVRERHLRADKSEQDALEIGAIKVTGVPTTQSIVLVN